MDFNLTIAVVALPLFMFLFLGLAGVKMGRKLTGVLGVIGQGVTTVLAYGLALTYFFGTGQGQIVDGVRQTIIVADWSWLNLGDKVMANIGFELDPIAAMMLIVITTISFFVHLYSLGYMSDHEGNAEKGFQRYYAFLALFTFSMLGMVVATNIFQIFVFFEMVGVSSYLLIGFYYSSPAAIHASKKAFIVTRLADFFFLFGVIVLGFAVSTLTNLVPEGGSALSFSTLLSNPEAIASQLSAVEFFGIPALPLSLICIFIGGAGKSAMYPLHIWLPDAMEGPTPVSALIHAATMVVAGVFLVARLFPLYVICDVAINVVAVTGAFTAFYAAAVACVQSDIKRALAFSTLSQIAYMMTALGVSTAAGVGEEGGLGYMASMFHLFTHAMFKALLFLVAGAVIHAVHSNENSAMHGLRKYMPISNIAFLIGCLAISGIPPFAGFFSKDEILVACYEKGTVWGLWMSMVAGMTAFYMFRIYFLIFHWKEHEVHEGHAQPHEGPWTMSLPLIALSAISVVCGLVPFGELVTVDGHALHTHTNWTVAISSVCVALVGIGFAFKLYYKENPLPTRMKNACSGLWEAAYRRFYMDEFYQFLTHKVIFQKICKPIAWFDRHCIDGFFNLLGDLTNSCSFAIRRLQSGNVQSYVYVYLMGALLLAVVTMACVLI